MQQQGQLVACSEARPEEADSVTDHVHTDNVSQNPYKPEVADFGERLTSLTLDNSLRVIYNPRIIPAESFNMDRVNGKTILVFHLALITAATMSRREGAGLLCRCIETRRLGLAPFRTS